MQNETTPNAGFFQKQIIRNVHAELFVLSGLFGFISVALSLYVWPLGLILVEDNVGFGFGTNAGYLIFAGASLGAGFMVFGLASILAQSLDDPRFLIGPDLVLFGVVIVLLGSFIGGPATFSLMALFLPPILVGWYIGLARIIM